MKILWVLSFYWIVFPSAGQIAAGAYEVSKQDSTFSGTYLTFHFGPDHSFQVWERECKSMFYGQGTYKLLGDSIYFLFDQRDTERVSVVITPVESDNDTMTTHTFRVFNKIRGTRLDVFRIGLKGDDLDTVLESLFEDCILNFPKSHAALQVACSTFDDTFNAQAIFELQPEASAHYDVHFTYVFDGYISDAVWAFAFRKTNRKGFALVLDGGEMRFKGIARR
jgi:hypothetical protein